MANQTDSTINSTEQTNVALEDVSTDETSTSEFETIEPRDLNDGQYLGSDEADAIQVSTVIEPSQFVIFGLQGDDTLYGGAGDDFIYAGQGNDLVDGFNGNDVLQGNKDNDYLTAGNGDDTLYGGQGNDTLSGEAGNDILSGDKGVDLLFGGLGADIFNLGPRTLENADLITDFVPGEDSIIINDLASFAEISLLPITSQAAQDLFPSIYRPINSGTLIQARSSGEVIGVLENINPDQLSILYFKFVLL